MVLQQDKPPESRSGWAAVGMAMTIPMMLLAGALVGYGLGWLVQRWTGWGDWVLAIGIGLGFAAGVRETIKIIRRLS